MKTQTLLLVVLLFLGAVAAAPPASAHHPDVNCPNLLVFIAPAACTAVIGTYDSVGHYAACYPNTAPVDWTDCL